MRCAALTRFFPIGSLAGIRFGTSRDVALKGFSGMHQLHLVEWPDASVSQ